MRLTATTPPQPGLVATGGSAVGSDAIAAFRYDLAVAGAVLTAEELAELTELKAPLVRLRGQWTELDPRRLAAGLKVVGRTGQATVRELLRFGLGVEAPPELAELSELNELTGADTLRVERVEAGGWLGDLLSAGTEHRLVALTPPDSFDGQLRPYQNRGLAWLDFLGRAGLGGVLADDMGLGKTVQLLALLASQTPGEPTLLVCPMSLVGNWQREAARFTPHLRVHVHHGAERARGAQFREAVTGCDLVITTYALAARDATELRKIGWRRVVVDEAQAIKNAATKQATAIRSIPARSRIAVTGTPVENRLADLWSILEFANPGLLGTAASFKKRYAEPIERHGDADAAERLRRFTAPFILRRLKTDRSVIADLPEKLEMDLLCNLTAEQAALYQAVVDDMLERIRTTEGIERRGLVLATMTKLKQVCNHPAHFLRDGSRLSGRSGKLDRLEEILEEVLAVGEKALLFTQYAEFGGMLRGHLAGRFGQEVLFLHGGVAKPARDAMVARFQAEDGGFTAAVRALAEGRRNRPDPDRGQSRRARGPLVEPGGGGPGDRPRVPDRSAAGGAGAQVRVRGHHRGEDRRDDRRQARAGRQDRRDRRAVADRTVHRPARRAVPARGRSSGRVSGWFPDRYPPSRPRDVENGLRARTARGAIGASWWSRRFLDVLESFAMGTRLTRGRAYARRGQVISLDVRPGRVEARVQGSRVRPYAVTIGLAAFSELVWAKAEIALSEQALPSAKLLAGEVPPELEEIFTAAGAPLFPRQVRDLDQRCSCPDGAVPCKHLAATFYLLAEAFDEDPFLILVWRGRDREALLGRLRELRADGAVEESAERAPGPAAGTALALADLADPVDTIDPGARPGTDRFWQPGMPLPPRPAVLEVEADLLLRQLPVPDAGLGGQVLIDRLRLAYRQFAERG